MSKVKDFFKGWSKFELCWLVLSTVIMIVLSIIWGDNTLALISGITGILGVVLAAKGKVSTYFFATINVAIYAYLTFNNHLYGEFMLNAFYYIPMNFIGFYLWSRHKDEKSGEVEGKALTPKQIVILLAATAVIVIIYWQILTHLGGQRLFCHCLDYAGCTLRRTMAVMDYCKYRIRHYVDSPDWKRFFCSYHGCNVDCLLIQLHIWILQLEKTCCEKQQTSLTPLVFRIFTNFPSPKILQLPKSSRSIFQSNRL